MKITKLTAFATILLLFAMLTGCAKSAEFDAVYLGVKNYGAAKTNADNKNKFKYRFEENGVTRSFKMWNGTQDEDGN